MSLRRKQNRRGASITSLIDVIFLLLLFFMLASTFSKQAEIELVAGAEGAATGKQPQIIRLRVTEDSIEIDGRTIAEETLVAQIADELSEPDSIIALDLTEDVTTQRLVNMLLTLRDIPDAHINIMEPS